MKPGPLNGPQFLLQITNLLSRQLIFLQSSAAHNQLMVAALVFDLINHRSGAALIRLELLAGRTTAISPNLINTNCPISSKLCTYYCSKL